MSIRPEGSLGGIAELSPVDESGRIVAGATVISLDTLSAILWKDSRIPKEILTMQVRSKLTVGLGTLELEPVLGELAIYLMIRFTQESQAAGLIAKSVAVESRPA